MPTGYRGEGKTYLKSQKRWVKKQTHNAFDYDGVDHESVAFLISFFRFYPDYFLDVFRSPTAEFRLELPQRLILRAFSRYRNVYITGARGLTKTYCVLLFAMANGVLYPGEVMRYCAPNQKQAAALATQAFHQIEKDYPALADMWRVRNDRSDMFYITTRFGSEFSMYAPRGSNASMSIAEEIGAEGAEAFDIDTYERNILPTVRKVRKVNQADDPTHINYRHLHISNACTKQNRAFTVHRQKALYGMIHGDPYEGFVLDIPWEVALLGNIRNKEYIKDQKNALTIEDFQREMCARYTGTNENPVVTDEVLSASRKLVAMEREHCGRDDAIYIVSHDVAYESGAKNALCADVVWKLTRFKGVTRREKYRKQCVWADSYPPPPTDYAQAMKLKDLWRRYCKDGAQATYLVVDARAYGKSVIEELMKPSDDGIPPLCCYNHLEYRELEQEGALPVIYPIKAGVRGSRDADADMIRYAQRELEQGNVELLTAAIADGIEQYKIQHGIKDNYSDARIALPYKKTDELCEQIKNLTLDASGTTLKEKRKSRAIQRDMWSAAKYGLHLAQILEQALVKDTYRRKSTYDDIKAQFEGESEMFMGDYVVGGNRLRGIAIADRSKLLGLRKR